MKNDLRGGLAFVGVGNANDFGPKIGAVEANKSAFTGGDFLLKLGDPANTLLG